MTPGIMRRSSPGIQEYRNRDKNENYILTEKELTCRYVN